jgi:hypothetical protein
MQARERYKTSEISQSNKLFYFSVHIEDHPNEGEIILADTNMGNISSCSKIELIHMLCLLNAKKYFV